MKATIKDRIVAHRSSPDVYDPPSFEQMADRIEELEERLKAAQDDAKEAEAYAEELEAKLAKAVEALECAKDYVVATSDGDLIAHEEPKVIKYIIKEQAEEDLASICTTLAELSSEAAYGEAKGGKDE